MLSNAQKYIHCFGCKRLLVQGLAQCRKIVRMYVAKLLYTRVKQMSNANYMHRIYVGIVNIQYTWSQKNFPACHESSYSVHQSAALNYVVSIMATYCIQAED